MIYRNLIYLMQIYWEDAMLDDVLPKLTPTQAEMLVLSVLAEGPSYGYAISKSFAARSGGMFSMGPAKLYPMLARLEKRGLISPSWEVVRAEGADEGSTGRRRKWYTLTDRGRQRLAQHVSAHRRFTSLIDAFITPREGATA